MAGLAGLGRPGDVPFVPRFGAFRDEVLEPRHHQTRRRNERGVDLLLHVRQAPIQLRNLELHAGVERVETPDFRPERRFQCVDPFSRAVRRSRPASFGRKKRPFGVESRPRFRAASMQPGFAAGHAAVCGPVPGSRPLRAGPDATRLWIVGNPVCTICLSSALAECLFCVSRRERLGETAHRGSPAPTSSTRS